MSRVISLFLPVAVSVKPIQIPVMNTSGNTNFLFIGIVTRSQSKQCK
jgi:hypothetical protein